ncbi:hypothetical protein A0J61_11508, partial [Choanephora cucurbitarum]
MFYYISNKYFRLVTCLIAALPIVSATPAWNTVNGYDLNGNQCPLPTYNAYPCPALCVRDITQCPDSVRPSCPAGQNYCIDGSCRDSCPDNLVSKCACPGAPDLQVTTVYPCLDDTRVNIENFDASNKAEQTAAACASYLGLSNVSSWSP